MKNRIVISFVLAGILGLTVVIQVLAGATFDYGTLEGTPPVGAANWTAWWRTLSNGTPIEILTEDNTNADEGINIGYSKFFSPDIVNWVLQIENFNRDPAPFDPDYGDHDAIYMIFGGLGENHSGTLWKETISAWIITESSTNHEQVPIFTTEGAACPTIQPQPMMGDARTVRFWGEPGTYHVYRSQNASKEGSDTSNGQYFWIQTVATNEYGGGIFTDTTFTTEKSWYVVIQADPSSKAIIGCHSEETTPTSVILTKFTGVYNHQDKAVELSWETSSEVDMLGFNLYRNNSVSTDSRTKLNGDAMISAKNQGVPEGESYDFVDGFDLTEGQTYYYWLEMVKTNSAAEMIGPVAVYSGGFELFLPLIQN